MLKDENKVKRIYNVYLNGKTENISSEEEKIAKELPSSLRLCGLHYIYIEREKIGALAPWLPPLADIILR